ncbi:MAG: hypothetical protein AB8B64_24670 [Granulosicoccus sp.]
MFDRVFHPVRTGALLNGVVITFLCAWGTPSFALEVGFEGLVQLVGSDNVLADNSPDEQNGAIQSAILGVYGEQRGRVVSAAFLGELDTRKISTSDESDVDAVSVFVGAAQFKLTPRAWTWYFANILGGVRADDAIQPIDNNDIPRRNLFVTGPTFEYEQQGISRTTVRLLYVNQTQDNSELEDLYIANFSHQRNLTSRNHFGLRLGNIFTDVPDQSNDDPDLFAVEQDFNRGTLGIFYNHLVGYTNVFGEIGFTRYDTDDESLDGLVSQIRINHKWGPRTSSGLFIQRNLNDQSLSAAESLVQNGEAGIGVEPDVAGIFSENRIGAEYNFQTLDTSISLVAGFAELEYELLSGASLGLVDIDGEDRQQGFATAVWSQRLNSRLRSELFVSFESQDFDNRIDNSSSLVVRAQLDYMLTRSIDLQLGIVRDDASGVRTQFVNNGIFEDAVESTENRFSLGLRWAPPSPASQELAIELQSLLQ